MTTNRISKDRISERDFERVMKALANRRRLAILRFLETEKEASVGTIAEEIKLSFRATSKHLSVLFAVGIVDREQRSTHMFYQLPPNLPSVARAILSMI